MKANQREKQRLTYSEKWFRMKSRLRDPEWRRYGKLLFLGKMLGIGAVLSLMIGVPLIVREAPKMLVNTAHAADDVKAPDAKTGDAKAPDSKAGDAKTGDAKTGTAAGGAATPAAGATAPAAPATAAAPAPDPYDAVKAKDIVNPINTVWTLVAAFLVFGMQVGFTMLEAGFCRSRETVNVLMECIVDTCLCGILFYAFGYAFMFCHGNGFIGWKWADDGPLVSSCKTHRQPMNQPAWHSWRTGFSSSRSPIPARRSPQAP